MLKLVVIVGPTASGKSALAVSIAKKIGGEVVSADSRQIYRGLDLSSGKITKREMQGIPHYMLDISSVTRTVSVAEYRRKALSAIHGIWKQNKVPILCGGTGFYVSAIVDGTVFPNVPPNPRLRETLEKKATYILFKMLQLKDPRRAYGIDRHNRRRLIRALEILEKQNSIEPIQKHPIDANILILGISKPQIELKALIHERLIARIKAGMIDEIRKIRASGVRWKKLESLGLEFKYIALFLQNKLSEKDFLIQLEKAIEHYAKRQMTWFKKDKRINWVKTETQAHELVKQFLP